MWAEYFPQAQVYGLDVRPSTLINEGRIHSFVCDQSKPEQLCKALTDHRIEPDLVVDDGSHLWSHQISTYRALYPLLKAGVVYIVEDLHTSSIKEYKDQEQSPLAFFSQLKDFTIVNRGPISVTGIAIKSRRLEDLTLGTCSFGTPAVTLNMLRSYVWWHGLDAPLNLCVMENSKDEATAALLTKEGIEFMRKFGGTHHESIDDLMRRVTRATRYLLLVDTDVVFLRDIFGAFDAFRESGAAIGGVVWKWQGVGRELYDRLEPWFCFMDVLQILGKGVRFFDPSRLDHNLKYDVGTSFLEDIRGKGLAVCPMSKEYRQQYINHFEGMSWRSRSTNEGIRRLSMSSEAAYADFVARNRLDGISLSNKFSGR
jgi:hypothetical protein